MRPSAFRVRKSKGPPRFAAQRTEEDSNPVPQPAPAQGRQEQSEEMTQTDVEGPRIVDVAARRAFELAVGKGALAQAELPADAVGHPAAAEVFVQRRAKTVLRSRAVGFTQEVVRVARVSVDRSGLVREVKARAEPDARDEVLVVVLFDLHAVRSRGVVALRETVG